MLACPTHTYPPGSGIGTGGILFEKHIYKSKQLYLLHNEVGINTQHNLLHNEAGSNTQHIFFHIEAGSNTQHIFFTMRPRVTHSISSSRMALSRMLLLAVAHSLYFSQCIPLLFAVDEFLLFFRSFFLVFCFVLFSVFQLTRSMLDLA